jgi:hypothetical protein
MSAQEEVKIGQVGALEAFEAELYGGQPWDTMVPPGTNFAEAVRWVEDDERQDVTLTRLADAVEAEVDRAERAREERERDIATMQKCCREAEAAAAERARLAVAALWADEEAAPASDMGDDTETRASAA